MSLCVLQSFCSTDMNSLERMTGHEMMASGPSLVSLESLKIHCIGQDCKTSAGECSQPLPP